MIARLRAAAVLVLASIPLSCGKPPPPPGGRLPTGLAYQTFYMQHTTASEFAERPERMAVILQRLKETGLHDQMKVLHPLPASLERILAVHTPAYVEHVRESCRGLNGGQAALDRMDVTISSQSFEVAVAAAGCGLGAVDAVMEGRVANAFCVVRPPGHHATPTHAQGFCIFNNAAIAARYLQDRWKLPKVLIVDWDAHHGNGTQEIFWEDGSVFYFSTHCSPLYPLTGAASERGAGKGLGCTLNVPIPRWSGDAEVLKAYEEKLKPAALAFKPDFILISAGFDAHEGEEAGKLKLSASGFAQMTRVVKEIARSCCGGRLVSLLEGGYNAQKLPVAVEAHVRALME